MKIASLVKFEDDLTLRWLNGVEKTSDGQLRISTLFRKSSGDTFRAELPFGMIPFLAPGLVVSRGEIQTARMGGKNGRTRIPDLSLYKVLPARKAFPRSHYDLGGYYGGEHRVLSYQASDWTILIPEMELIRFLFLHGKVMANAILQPMGLLDLALTPVPGHYPEILVEFQPTMPHAIMRNEFVQEFAWAAVDPDGRKSWDSVRRVSSGQGILMLEPPPLQNSRIEFRGVPMNKTWLVLEIIALSGRKMPAQVINWTHPSERERSNGQGDGKDQKEQEQARAVRPPHVRDHVIDDEAKSKENVNQAVILLGGKRGVFDTPARVVKLLSSARPIGAVAGSDDQGSATRKTRSDVGKQVDPSLPPLIINGPVSMGERAHDGGLRPLEVSTLDPVDWGFIGDLRLLVKVLIQVERSVPDLTLTAFLVLLKTGRSVSYTQSGRRACLVAVFTSHSRPPQVVLDVDHSNLPNGLSGLLLRYHRFCTLADMEGHVKLLLDGMVERSGHWQEDLERNLSDCVTVTRLRKFVRATDRNNDREYVKRWISKVQGLLSVAAVPKV